MSQPQYFANSTNPSDPKLPKPLPQYLHQVIEIPNFENKAKYGVLIS